MSLLSRFRKQKEDEASEELDETLANSEEEGLFISTGAEQASPGEEDEPAAGTPGDKDATNQAEIDDLLEAAEDDASSTIGEAVAESSDATLADENAPASSEVEADDLLEAAQAEPAAAEGADAALEGENAAASESEVDDLLEVAQDGGGGAEQENAADAELEEEANPLDTGTDALAAFGEVEVESEIGDLLKGLEEVSAEELVTELREIRAMLPQIEEGQEEA